MQSRAGEVSGVVEHRENKMAAGKEVILRGSQVEEMQGHFEVSAENARDQANTAWRDVEAKVKDGILRRHYS